MNHQNHMTGQEPLMNLGMQSISSTSNKLPRECMIPRAFNHKNAFVRMPLEHLKCPPTTKSKANPNKNSRPTRTKRPSNQQRLPVFQHLTLDSMKVRFGHNPPAAFRCISSDDSMPAIKRRKTENMTPVLPKKPLLRPSQPLKNADDVDIDIWQNILSFCSPKFLIEAKTISSFFYHVLSNHPSIWRKSRLHHFGSDMPDRPEELSEQQFVDLLVGRGCQSSTCTRPNTVKVYWTFLGRFCTECLARRTLRAEDLGSSRQHFISDVSFNRSDETSPHAKIALWMALPMAASNGRRYLHARPVSEAQNRWAPVSHGCFLFLKSDYARLESEYLQLRKAKRTDAQIYEWWQTKFKETMRLMVEVSKLEIWLYLREADKRDVRAERKQYFQFHAAQLSPPMSRAVLHCMAAYQKALNSNNPPSIRAWTTLKAKILPYQQQAETLVQHQLERNSSIEACSAIQLFRRLHRHRSGRRQEGKSLRPEQQFVLNLATQEFNKCLDEEVADSDLVLLCLKRIYECYEKCKNRPCGLSYDGSIGPYKLSMDDARMIVEEIMEERISRYSQRGGVIFDSFKCAGCVRKDYCRKWSFNGVFEHIIPAHSQLVGRGYEFWRYAVPFPKDREYDKQFYQFPWYTVPWPRCLPVLPEHRDAANLPSWDPDARTDYIQIEKAGTRSAFAGHRPTECHATEDDFVGNFVYAAKTLNGVRLTSVCQTKIALEYALRRYTWCTSTVPQLDALIRAVPLARDVNPAMDFKFKCGYCKSEGRVYRSARQVKYFVPIEQLHKHWIDKHKTLRWTSDFLDLPSDTEVYDQIIESDRRLFEEKESVRTTTAVVAVSSRKRPNLKANVILGTKSAMEIFDTLFTEAGRAV